MMRSQDYCDIMLFLYYISYLARGTSEDGWSVCVYRFSFLSHLKFNGKFNNKKRGKIKRYEIRVEHNTVFLEVKFW